jgi:hypothetical protein
MLLASIDMPYKAFILIVLVPCEHKCVYCSGVKNALEWGFILDVKLPNRYDPRARRLEGCALADHRQYFKDGLGVFDH